MGCQSDPQRSRQLRMTDRLGVWGQWWPLIIWRDCLVLLHFAWHLSITKLYTVGVIYSRLYKGLWFALVLPMSKFWMYSLGIYILVIGLFHLHVYTGRISLLSNVNKVTVYISLVWLGQGYHSWFPHYIDVLTLTNVTFAMFHVYGMSKQSPKEQTIAHDWSSWCIGPLMTT